MKKLLVILLLIFPVVLFAQEDVTRFLDIPVDGDKIEMIRKLKAKGFVSNPLNKDVLNGKFNGTDVNVQIVTNNGKVCRIMVCDANTMGVGDIKIRFNKLCRQFMDNGKYMSASQVESDYTLSDDEDIEYEMLVHHRRYEAAFYQLPAAIDSVSVAKEMLPLLTSKYTLEQLASPTEELRQEMITMVVSHMFEKCSKKLVWFMINESYGKYYITMFYDNEYNRANGEDL